MPRNQSPFDVNDEALRFIVKNVDGDLRLSTDPYSPGLDFFTTAVRDVQHVLVDVGLDAFLSDARGHSPSYGGGTPLDALRPLDHLYIAAAIDATEFKGYVHDLDINDLESAVKWTLFAIYSDVFSAVGAALEAEELGWNGFTLAVAK